MKIISDTRTQEPFEIKINGGGDWLFDADVYNNAQLVYKISPIPILFQF